MKTAVILFNLGGPDRLEAVRPFLFNLFNDPAIIRLPGFLRGPLARLISSRRERVAEDIYKKIGGHSPILRNTQLQAEALDAALGGEYRCFVAMRYWHPFVEEALEDVRDYAPDRIVLLPLYPQFSTTTTASSFTSWRDAAKAAAFEVPTRAVCCYPQQSGFIRALAALATSAYDEAAKHGTPRVLFSAHGLPEKIVRAGDPYAWQCEQTVAALVAAMGVGKLDHVLCYQSRVGPLRWIGPATDAEIRRAGEDKVPLVVVPIAFVSEHSETLVEIDMEYRHLAEQGGVPYYVYAGTVSTAPDFISGLAEMARNAAENKADCSSACSSASGARLCPAACKGCPCEGR